MGMARTRLVAGNWKMHGSRAANRALLEAIVKATGKGASAECAVCVPFRYSQQLSAHLAGTAPARGAHTATQHAQAPSTGEVRAAPRPDFGRRYVLGAPSARPP